mgnify:FL=1|tara:strand:- start:156 stop:650 length:495 start_codon:yes stop_codon:yes gene_type:complete
MIELRQYTNAIFVSNLKNVKCLRINYLGTFTANIHHNTAVKIQNDNLFIAYNEIAQNEHLMDYNGQFIIKKITAHDSEYKKIKVTKYAIDDRLGNLNWKFGEETKKLIEFNQIINAHKTARTVVSYEKNNRTYLKNSKNKLISPKILTKKEALYINNRGKYGIK